MSANWLHNPCRLGDPRSWDIINSGSPCRLRGHMTENWLHDPCPLGGNLGVPQSGDGIINGCTSLALLGCVGGPHVSKLST